MILKIIVVAWVAFELVRFARQCSAHSGRMHALRVIRRAAMFEAKYLALKKLSGGWACTSKLS